jgi:hypothetical protein
VNGGRISIFERLCENISLAPGFSRVTVEKREIQPFQRLFGAGEPVKTDLAFWPSSTPG